MVKDDRHRTRALVDAKNNVIHIDGNPALFSLIGNIQEETHRFAITYHRSLRSRRLRYSALDAINGIGPVRKQELIRHFSSIKAISQASVLDLEQVLPHQAAAAVYKHFHSEE
jgi:excinuclease ABC subunit C